MRREEGETSSSIPRHPRSPVVGPLEDDDLLLEILLRLPPQPSSLPRASAVCRRWRLLISEPGFSRRFRRYHRGNLPIIGFYDRNPPYLSFVPALEGPDRIPPGRLSWQCQREEGPDLSTFGCRDGLVLVHVEHLEPLKRHVLVWDPITGEQHNPGIPPGFDTGKRFNGAVFRSAGDADHFQVVLVGNGDNQLPVASVYSSETDVWSNLFSTSLPLKYYTDPFPSFIGLSLEPAVLVRNSLHWLLGAGSVGILEFDLERHNLVVIGVPVHVGAGCHIGSNDRFSIIRAEDGGLGFLSLSDFNVQLWKRKTEYDGVASWVMEKIIELDKLLKIPLDRKNQRKNTTRVMGFAEDNNTVFMWTIIGIIMIHLESVQVKTLPGSRIFSYYYPFESVWCM
ncbi:hypothetical protein CFC21_091248 [Triticum aestivum]|uniref:F-box domain-containing protein n=1 Tax=Triticum aestivum TaxID=4565 RepID=A0A9R1LFW9_WHEAT|nr:hypothetical protein CFC21_091248 [Triticum aestivum]